MPSVPPGRPIHPDPNLDAFLGNMVANRGCEVMQADDYVILFCACPKWHRKVILKNPTVHQNYANNTIDEVNQLFSCSRRN